jgi:predicted transcriptional regulator of viral defense system
MNITSYVTSDGPDGLRPLVALAARQGGYFTTSQASGAGVSRRMLSYYHQRGDLERDSYGIYRVTWLPRHRFGDVIAACLWADPASAAASMETALAVHGLSDAMPTRIHITVPKQFTGRRDGVSVHVAPVSDRERVVVDDVPVTSVARTLVDVAPRNRELAVQAKEEAVARGLTSSRAIRAAARNNDDAYKALVATGA